MRVLILFISILSIINAFSSKEPYSLLLKVVKASVFTTVDNNLDAKCAADLRSLFTNVSRKKFWALKMLDATSKLNSGILQGNINLIGDFDMCLSIKEEVDEKYIEGQYCTVLFSVSEDYLTPIEPVLNIRKKIRMDIADFLKINISNATFPIGICIPKTCSHDDFEVFLNTLLKKFKIPLKAFILDKLCLHKNKGVKITKFDSFVYNFFKFILLLVCGSTIYDLYLQSNGRRPNILIIFSIWTNTKKFGSCSQQQKCTLFSCLDGIRVLTTLWIFLAHFLIMSLLNFKNIVYILTKWRYSTISAIYSASIYGLDTFLVISGLLLTYFKIDSKESLFHFYSKRIVRLTPPLLAVLFLQSSVLKLLSDGPFGEFSIHIFTRYCYKNWWKHLFFLTNFLHHKEMCAHHTWYLSVDFQLFLLSPLILRFISRFPKRVITGIITVIIFSFIYTFSVMVTKELGFTAYEWSDDYITYIHMSLLHHMPSWLIGALFGYLLRAKQIKLSKTINLFLWILSLSIIVKIVLLEKTFIEEQNVYRAAFWRTFANPMWSLAICFIIVSCATGHGGIINQFLSHSFFHLFSKLTYSLYLIQIAIIAILVCTRKNMYYYDSSHFIVRFLGVLVITMLCSFILYLIFEAPLIALKNYLDKSHKRLVDKNN